MNQELLYKYFKGITSVEEEKMILDWIDASDENRNIFLKERMIYDISLFSDKQGNNEKKTVRIMPMLRWAARIAAVTIVAIAELQAAFSAYLPGCAECDFYEMELGTAGMMRGYMARQCDPYFTLERKIRRFLSMSLSALQVPAQEREQVIAFVAEIDMLAQARKVVDAVLASLSVQFDLKG